jgi:hypothetical protein
MALSKNHMLREPTAIHLWARRDYGRSLAAWLNSDFESEVEARREVALTIREINENTVSLREPYEIWLDTPNEWTEQQFSLAAEEIHTPRLIREAIPILKPYTDPRLFGRLELQWRYGRGTLTTFREAAGMFMFGMEVSKAIQCLVELAEEGRLGRMRECAKCSKWLCATFRHQRFCSIKCQQAHYRSSSEWKAHRAAWMRDYRLKTARPNVLTKGEREGMKQRQLES